MSVQLAIINERVSKYAEVYGDSQSDAFLKFVYSLLRRCDYDELAPEDMVDGGADKQIDVISIDEDHTAGISNILIIQAKNTESFQSNALALMGNGLSWIFEKSKDQYASIANRRFVAKIEEIRELRTRSGPSNMSVQVLFVTKGDSSRLSAEFKEEFDAIQSKYSEAGFREFHIAALGTADLVKLLGDQERKQKQVDDCLSIVMHQHRPSYIRYSTHGMNGYICTVRAKEIARLVAGEREQSVFDLNLRRFYGADRGGVNPGIAETAGSAADAHMFWFFNNGITIVCDRCDVVDDLDKPHLKLTNLQIVNGCQTSMTLADLEQKGLLRDNVEVQVKVFEEASEKFVRRVVITTNNQNSISSRDLKANDPVQEDYQRAFLQLYGLRYERKPREFQRLPKEEAKNIVSNEKVAQAYLAIVKKRPTIARTQKYRVWDQEWYPTLFPSTTGIQKHVLAYLIYEFCLREKRTALTKWAKYPSRYSIVSYGVFHLARVLAFYFTGSENWEDEGAVNSWIAQITADPRILQPHYMSSVTLLNRMIGKKKHEWENINNVFKAGDIEGTINKELAKLTPVSRDRRKRRRVSKAA